MTTIKELLKILVPAELERTNKLRKKKGQTLRTKTEIYKTYKGFKKDNLKNIVSDLTKKGYVKNNQLRKVTYYFTKNPIKGIDGVRLYFVKDKEDIKYLGGRMSKYTALSKPKFKKFMREYYNEDVKIINV